MVYFNLLVRSLVLVWVVGVYCTRTASAQDWVRDMFEKNSHNFGNVPRGAETEYRFKLTNRYEEDVHIASVRSSCGCTIPRVEKADLKTYEEGDIICEFNTRSFIGPKSAVVTVVFDRPYYGEMQLMVEGNIRSDIVTEPGQIQFGDVDRGTEKFALLSVSYAGKNHWEITDVRSTNQYLAVSNLDRVSNGIGKVEYQMRVRLKDTAPAGDFNDQVVIVTNDLDYNLVTIPVRGKVNPPLRITATVALGTIPRGKKVDEQILVVGKRPFEITKVECSDKRFSFMQPPGMNSIHRILMTFEPSGEAAGGAFKEKILVHTSLAEDGIAVTEVIGNVTE